MGLAGKEGRAMPRGKGKGPGRPNEFNYELLDAILQYRMSLSDCAEILKVNSSTIVKRIKTDHKCKFSEYRDKKMAKVRLNLTQKAIDMANKGCKTMMIFCLKNYCGWVDSVKQENEITMKPVVINRVDGSKVELGYKEEEDKSTTSP